MRPQRFEVEPETLDAEKRWTHWLVTFENFLQTLYTENIQRLTNYVCHTIHEIIMDCTTYEEAIAVLQSTHKNPQNEAFSRYLLATRRQQNGESLEQFLIELHTLSKDCNFRSMNAEEIRDEHIMDAFINGLQNAQWAPDRKGLFSGFIVAGFGGGSFIFNYIQTSYLNPRNKVARVEVNGNKYFDQEDILQRVPTLFLILGGTYMVMQFIGCMLLFQPPSTTPSTQEEDCRAMIESEVNEDGQAKTDVNVVAKTPSTPSTPIPPENILDPPIEVHPVQIIKTRAFWTLAFIFLFNGLGVIIVSAMFKAYGQTFIKDDYFLTLVASVSALFNASGRLLWGYIGDKYSFKLGMSLLSGLFCILVLLLTVTSIAGKYFFLIWICLIFLTFSGNYSLFPYAIGQTFGLRYYSINYGLLFTTQAVSGLVGAIITTLLYDTMGWSGLFFLVSGMTFISMLLAFSFNAKKPDGSDI